MTTSSGLADYCASCVRGRGCSRLEVLTQPVALKRIGRSGLVAMYKCPRCVHRWTCCWAAEMWLGGA